MASIGIEETQNDPDSSRAGFPSTNFSGSEPSGQGAYDGNQMTPEEEVADQLQRELELFAQDDDEEASTLIKTDN